MAEHKLEHIAWLLWCAHQGYLLKEDRAILTNWFLEPPENDHPDDNREGWLQLADAVIEALED